MADAYLYRVFDADDRLLYVGATMLWDQRLAKHRTAAPWYDRAATVRLEPQESITDARRAERTAIATELPEYNVHHGRLANRPPRPVETVSAAMAHRRRVGKRIRDARRECGFTCAQIAAEVGVTRASVSNWERGNTLPHSRHGIALAKALNAPWSALFGLDAEVAS